MIILVEGTSAEARNLIANALRVHAVANGAAALLIGPGQAEAEARPLVEKIIKGLALPLDKAVPADEVPWKKNALVILNDPPAGKLEEIEECVPGFIDHHGPSVTVTINEGIEI